MRRAIAVKFSSPFATTSTSCLPAGLLSFSVHFPPLHFNQIHMKLRSGRFLDSELTSNNRPRKRHRRIDSNDALNDDCLLLIFQAMEHTPTTLSTLRLVCQRWTRLLEVACVVSHCALVYSFLYFVLTVSLTYSGETWYWIDNSLELNIRSLSKVAYCESISIMSNV